MKYPFNVKTSSSKSISFITSVNYLNSCTFVPILLSQTTDGDDNNGDDDHSDDDEIQAAPSTAQRKRMSTFVHSKVAGRTQSYQNRLKTSAKKTTPSKGHQNYICNICNKKFPKLSKLKRHTLIHTKDKPFPCETCEKKFSQKSHLIQHRLFTQ